MPLVDADVEWEGDTPADLQRKLSRFDELLIEEVNNALEELALMIEREAKQRSPVDSGTLRASIGHVVEEMASGYIRAVVGTNVDYAPEIEFGRGPITADGQALRFTIDGEVIFRKSVGPAPAQPFLSPALHAVEGKINGRLKEAVNRAEARV